MKWSKSPYVPALMIADKKLAANYRDWQNLVNEIQGKITDPTSTSAMKRNMSKIQPISRLFSTLTRMFSSKVEPFEVKFDLLWGLVFLNLKVYVLS